MSNVDLKEYEAPTVVEVIDGIVKNQSALTKILISQGDRIEKLETDLGYLAIAAGLALGGLIALVIGLLLT